MTGLSPPAPDLPPPSPPLRPAGPPGPPVVDPAPEWLRLDPRMLVVGPLHTLRQFAIPLVVGLVGISSSAGGVDLWFAGPMAVLPLVLGLLPWLTTRYRVTETQFLLRRGLLNRQQVTAPLDRVRSVDLESTLLHRLLGLAKVQIGTGVDETRIELNALSTAQADVLRLTLLARGSTVATGVDHAAGAHLPAGGVLTRDTNPPPPSRQLAGIDWSWLRFAPFSLSQLAIVAGAIGALSQWGDSLPFLDRRHLDSAWQWLGGFALPLVVLAGIVAAAISWVVISVTGYVVQWWDLRLVREAGALRLTAGLFTTRSTTVEEARVRGVQLTEPVLLRLVRGAELATLATGVGSGGITKVLPRAPARSAISSATRSWRTTARSQTIWWPTGRPPAAAA
ncbi:MAG: PH domain-containing protein [Nocardioides sp.]